MNRPPKRHADARRGQEFTPHGTDSVGVIVSDPQRNRKTIQFRYRHDPETLHTMQAHEFNDRFCALGATPTRERTVKVTLRVETSKFAAAVHAATVALKSAEASIAAMREQARRDARVAIAAGRVPA